MRSRVSIMYAASISVMKNTKMTRLTPTMRSRTARAISSEFSCAYVKLLPTASAIRRFGSKGSPFFSCTGSRSHPVFVSVTATPVPTSMASEPSGCGRATIQ